MGNTARTTVKFLIVCFIVWRSNWIFFRFDLTIAYRLRENVLQTHFDSNAISPGTQFMVSLETVLMEYLSNKIKHQTSWQSCEIYVSGSNVCANLFFHVSQSNVSLNLHPFTQIISHWIDLCEIVSWRRLRQNCRFHSIAETVERFYSVSNALHLQRRQRPFATWHCDAWAVHLIDTWGKFHISGQSNFRIFIFLTFNFPNVSLWRNENRLHRWPLSVWTTRSINLKWSILKRCANICAWNSSSARREWHSNLIWTVFAMIGWSWWLWLATIIYPAYPISKPTTMFWP